jgi:hypothetical protein
MQIQPHILRLSFLGLWLSSCASQETTYWSRNGNTVVVHHVSRTQDGLQDRSEKLITDELPKAKANELALSKSHSYYQVTQSTSTIHPEVRGSKSQKVGLSEAVAQAEEAKTKLDAARHTIEDQLESDKQLREQLKTVIAENQRLQNPTNGTLPVSGNGDQQVRVSQ